MIRSGLYITMTKLGSIVATSAKGNLYHFYLFLVFITVFLDPYSNLKYPFSHLTRSQCPTCRILWGRGNFPQEYLKRMFTNIESGVKLSDF